MGGEDACAGRGRGGGAVAQIGLGDKADCRRVGVQPEYGEAISCGGRLGGDSPGAPQAASRQARRVAGGALSSASRQLRCGAAGPVARARVDGVVADGGARGSAVTPGAASRGAGLSAVRDGAGQAAADRLWRDHGADRRRAGAGAPVCGDAGLLATAVCPGLPARAAIGLVRRHGGRVPALWRGAAGGAVRQCAGTGRSS